MGASPVLGWAGGHAASRSGSVVVLVVGSNFVPDPSASANAVDMLDFATFHDNIETLVFLEAAVLINLWSEIDHDHIALVIQIDCAFAGVEDFADTLNTFFLESR